MFLTLFLLAIMTQSDTPLTPGEHIRSLVVSDRQRNYLLHVPRSYDGKKPVPVILAFHGTDDKFAPFKGGRGERSLSQTEFHSVEHSIGCWVKANGCRAEPVVTEEKAKVEDGTKVTRKTWGGGKNGSEVVLIEITGAGHTWPGRQPALLFLGKSTKNISANDEMWEFFKKHPRKSTGPV